LLFSLAANLSWAELQEAKVGPADKASILTMPTAIKPDRVTLTCPENKDRDIPVFSTDDEPTILFEDFEGNFPEDNGWTLYNGDNGYTWDDDDYKPYNGNLSGWCAGGSYSGNLELDPEIDNYPNNMNGWMVYGPFDLSDPDITSARVAFKYWLDSEIDHDYFYWLASIDGTHFYGYKTSGNSSNWVERLFDLTNVSELGNLCGESQVWIAFLFRSDNETTYKGVFLDDIEIKKNVGELKPNLTPYKPTTWDYPIVPSSVKGTHTVGMLYANQPTYVDFAVINNGWASITSRFHTALYIDDKLVVKGYCDGLDVYWYVYYEDFSQTISEGYHTLKIVTDCDNEVDESNENDNEYIREFYWAPSNICEGDFDSDGDVDGSDLSIFAADFGRTDCGSGPPCEGDFDNDSDVDGSDLAVFAADFGRTDCLR
jgi:hypothetical protein